MKATKYVLVAAGIVVVLVTIAWFLRDHLIERVSNPLLDAYGFSVTDVSLDALATSDASIGHLELAHDKGTTIAIEELTLPFGALPKRTRIYTAKKVTIITETRKDGALFELAQLINQFISLPANLGDSKVIVAEFSLPPYPPVYGVHWELTDGEQSLRGSIESIPVSLSIARTDANHHDVVISLAHGSATQPGHAVTATLQQGQQGILISGSSSIDLPTWEPVARLSGLYLPEIDVTSGTATLQFDVDIPADATMSPSLAASLAPTTALQLTYASKSDDVASILVESTSTVSIAATLAEADWSLQQAQASLRVDYGDWRDIPLTVSSLSCRSGPDCSMQTKLTMGAAELPIGRVGQLEFASTEKVRFSDTGLRIDIRPGATLNIKKLANSGATIEEVEAQLVSNASIELLDAEWRLAADSIDAQIRSASVSDDVSVTAPLLLDNVRVSEIDDTLSASSGIHAPSGLAKIIERSVALPRFRGNFSLRDNEVAIDLAPVGLYQDGRVTAQHDIDSHAGALKLSNTAVSFQTTSLSDRVSPWPEDLDLVAGTAAFEFDASWTQEDSLVELDAKAAVVFSDLAGYYADNAFTGLSTQVNVAYRTPIGFVAEPATINVALIDTGLRIENLSSAYALNLNAMSVDVENLQMMAFGGMVRADPFSFHTDRDRNTLTLRAESIDLNELLSLNQFETVEVSGSIDAMLPMTIEGQTVTIEAGTLSGTPDGGVIRYKPRTPPDESDASAIGLATRALSNFEFDTLTSDVNLTREGDLNLKLRLTGRNPTLDEKRPVVLNLGVENNVPQMLKSLRAARAVEEILEKRLSP